METQPSVIERHRRLARAAFTAHDPDALDDACQALMRAAPQDAEARKLLGRQALRDLRLDDAEHYLREAAAHDPASPTSWLDVARVQAERRRMGDAEATLAAAETRGVRSAGFMTFLGALQTALGRPEDAAQSLFTAIELDPRHARAYRILAEIGALRSDDPHCAKLETLANAPDTPTPKRAMALYALAEIAANDGDNQAFIANVLKANAEQAANAPASDPHIDTLKKAVKAAKQKQRHAGAPPDTDPPIIFILGLPGGGAELCEHVLWRSADVRPGGHLGALAGPTQALAAQYDSKPAIQACMGFDRDTRIRLAERYLFRTQQLDGDSFVTCTDSDPANTPLALFAAAIFANAKFVRVNRDGNDAAFAVARRAYAQPARHQCDLRTIGRGIALTRASLDAFCEQRSDVITVEYADLVRAPVKTAKGLVKALHLPSRRKPPLVNGEAASGAGLGAWAGQRAANLVKPGSAATHADALAPMFEAIRKG